jgi:tetratricopeptide (TPR) repeat protein
MAPEQRTPGATLSERTDVYSLGLVLYELLVGRHPFRDSGTSADPPAPSSLVRNVDRHLDKLIIQALSQNPAQRPASAAEFGDGLTTTDRPRTATGKGIPLMPARRGSTHWIAVSVVVVLIAIAAGASSWLTSARLQPLTEQDTIVLADFQNTTGEMVFDGALKVALAVALEQSPFLKVFPDERARDTLNLMQRPPDAPLTRGLAREIARREQLKALIAGSIGRLGSNYVLTLEAINAETGDVMARDQAEAERKEDVLTSLGAASSRLRKKLGESLASIQRFDAPLPRATTGSIEALHAYALAFAEGPEVPRLRAVPHLQRAIQLDPSFALAHAQLSGVYTNTGQSSLAPTYSRRAFELRDRVSERERFFISWRYYRDAIQDADKALELAQSWTATYPREAFASNALGAALIRVGRFEESIAPFREAIRLDEKFSPAYSNVAAALIALNRYDEARTALQDASARKLEFNGLHRLSYLLASIQNDAATMERELEAGTGANETNAAYGWKAHSLGFAGRPNAAHTEFRRGVELSLQGSFREVAAQLSVEDAETHALVGQCMDVRSEVSAALNWSRDNTTLERASRALALCGAVRDATTLSDELARRFPESTLTNRVALPVTGAILALDRGDAKRALELLERTRPYDRAPFFEFWTFYLHGQALLAMRDGTGAAAQFRDIIEHRGTAPVSLLYPLAHLGLARAMALGGDEEATRRAYEQFFALWRDAEPDVRPLAEARAEYARRARDSQRPEVTESRAR